MSFLDAVKSGLRNFANFKGRAPRSEYWWFVLFSFFVPSVASAFSDVLGQLASLLLLLPSIAVGVRRLHDSDKQGWWLLLPVVNLVMLLLRGDAGSNRFGEPFGGTNLGVHRIQDSPRTGATSTESSPAIHARARSEPHTNQLHTPPVVRQTEMYSYGDAPVTAVLACVKAIEAEGIACNPATFEADIDRIVAVSTMDDALESQLASWPKEVADLMRQMDTPQDLAVRSKNRRLAVVVRSNLGPWLR